MSITSQKGNMITYIIIVMTTIAALAVGAFYMTSSTALGEIGVNNLNRAYFLALAGKDYALINNLGNTISGGRAFTLKNGNQFDQFLLEIIGDSIKSTGVVGAGTPFETRRSINITKVGFSYQRDINFINNIQSFASPVQSQAGFITTDTTAGQVSLGKIGMGNSFGSFWYGGSAIQGSCTNGLCNFGKGFRVFFVFQFGGGSSGDGFTFAFFNGNGADINGVRNSISSVGGDISMGELMGYAGDSRLDTSGTSFLDGQGRGIQPPKVAVEFDPYSDQCGSCWHYHKKCLCSSCSVCSNGSRCDGPTNHMAYVFWGDNTTRCGSTSGSTVGLYTFDDNKHGAGSNSSTEPQNARSSIDPAGQDITSYFDGSAFSWPSNWLLNVPTNIYAIRIEVTRGTTPDLAGNYDYALNTWIKQCAANDITCPTYNDTSTFANTKINYGDVAPGDKATLSRTFSLTPIYHQDFDTFYFGWTTATGGATQNVTITRFGMNFIQ